MSASASTYGFQTAIIVGLRGFLSYASRRYLLRHLYHDLQDLSAKSKSDANFDAGEAELETLPTSSSASAVPATTKRQPFHSVLSQALFSLCFSESCTLFLLLICQALEIFHPSVRLLNWRISLFFLVIAIVLVIPLSYSLVLSNGSNAPGVPSPRQRVCSMSLILYLIPNFLFLLALSYVPLPRDMPAHNIMASTLSRLTVIGTVMLGGLSGFGAIETAWGFFPVLSRTSRAHPTEEEVRTAEAGLQRVRDDLTQRRNDLRNVDAAKKPDTQASWLYRNLPSFQSSESSSLGQEVSGLESLEYEMARNLEVLKQRQADARFARTVGGRAFDWGGRVFAVYCIYRILSSIVSLVLPRASPPGSGEVGTKTTNADVVSLVLAHMLAVLPFVHVPADKVAAISRQVSLVLVGIIILSSIRRVLRGVAGVLRVTSRSLGASLMLLTLAQVMGMYLLSTLIQLRTSFPPPPPPPVRPGADGGGGDVEGLRNLFGTLPEFELFGALFDGAFLVAAGASAGARWFRERVSQ